MICVTDDQQSIRLFRTDCDNCDRNTGGKEMQTEFLSQCERIAVTLKNQQKRNQQMNVYIQLP